MDFSFTPDQDELRALTRRILDDTCTPDHLRDVAQTESGTDLQLWSALGAAGIVGIALPEAAGGGGYGFLETAIVLEEVARAAAPVPAFAVTALAGPALGGRPDLLDGVASGEVVVTAALHEPVGDPSAPATAAADGTLTGTKVCVPHGLVASRFVVSATDGLYVVERDASGLEITRQDTTTGVPDAMLVLDRTPAERLGGPDELTALLHRGTAAACVMSAGACAAALALTAEYTVSRRQFDKPIASFQAVSQRAGDAYIDTEAVRLTAWQAAWRLANGMPVEEHLLSAKFWAAEGGWRVAQAAHHVHGGVGVDRDYPLHRYFLMLKQLELQLGSAQPSLSRLGKLLADTPV